MIVFDGMDSALARLLFLLLLTTGPMTDDTSCSVVACPLLPHARWVLHLGWASSSSTSTWQGWTACAFIAFALLVMLYYMVASTASCPWMARGFIYFVAFVLFTVIDSGMTWTTWRSLACASGRLLAFLAWLHLLRRLRGPCGALLHDGVGCSELDGWCSLTSSCFVGADAGPLRQSWRRFALGPLCPARVANYLVAFVPLAVTYGEKAWTTSSFLAGACWLVPSRFLGVASPTSACFVILAVLFYTMAWAAPSSLAGAPRHPLAWLMRMLGHFGSQGDGLLWGPLRLLPGGGGPKPRASAMLFFLGWKLGASPSAVLGAWCSTCSLRYCFSTVGDLAGLLGQLVATLFGFGGAACSYFDDFDPFIVDLDGYS